MHTADASPDSELNTTMHDAMWRGHGGWEMAAVPAFFGLGGWLVDGWLGTTPIITIIAAAVGLGGSVANQYYRYNDRMTELESQRRDAVAASIDPAAPRFAKTAEVADEAGYIVEADYSSEAAR